MESLAVRGYSKIMLEAGPRLSLEFLKADLVNELVIYQKISKEDYQKIKRLKAFLSLDFSQSAPEFTYLKKFLSDDFTSNLLKSTQPIYIKLDFCYSENSEEESNVDEEVGIPDMEIRIGKYPKIL
jgi:hypothetical protein